MPEHAMEITPVGAVNEVTGEVEIADFAVNGLMSEEIRQEEEFNQQRRFVQDEETGEFNYQADVTDEDYENIISSYGTQEEVQEITDWALNYYPAEDIALYNEILERGDLNEIAHAVELIHKSWENYNPDADYTLEQNDPENIQLTESQDYIFRNVLGYDDYQTLIEWAADNLDEGSIENYDRIMDSNDREMMAGSVRSLLDFYRRNN